MRAHATSHFLDQYNAAPRDVQRAFRKQLGFPLHDRRHPSLQAKKYDEARGLWQARVTLSWRFYFTVEGDTYVLRTIIPHPK